MNENKYKNMFHSHVEFLNVREQEKKATQLLLADKLFLLGLVEDQRWWLLITYTHFCPQSTDVKKY